LCHASHLDGRCYFFGPDKLSHAQRLEVVRRHCALDDPHLLDVSWGKGRIWRRSGFDPAVRLDIRQLPRVTHRANWLDLPKLFPCGSFDLAVWDPIHVPDVGRTSVRYARYAAAEAPVKGKSILPLVSPFQAAVRPVLDPTSGTLIIKVKDINHARRVHWQVRRLLDLAEDIGWLACDQDLSLGPLTDDPKWQMQYLAPKYWSNWLVLHTAARCPGRGVRRPRARRSEMCGKPFRGRADAVTCSARCRKRRQRDRAALA
jgi:hypothetical protein